MVDLSERGQQPIWSSDRKVAILFNGEMYNFRDERERLRQAGYCFRSTSDAEVVLALYLEKGGSFASSIRGMFALALLDWRSSGIDGPPTVLLARDRFGMKPLWISERGEQVLFASELRALLASGLVPADLDGDGVSCYLEHGFVLQPGSILRGVRMVEAGTYVQYRGDRPPQVAHFASEPASPAIANESFSDAARRLRTILEESVALHSHADAPLGAFLSGGIDSSAIVALMRPHVARLRTYSLGWQEGRETDETAEASATAARFDCDHTEYVLPGREVASIVPEFAGDLDQPSADGLNTWLVSRLAARDVKGVMSGLGGDEWFAGYPVSVSMGAFESRLGAAALRAMGHGAHLLAGSARNTLGFARLRSLGAYRSPMALWTRSHTVFSSREVGALTGKCPKTNGVDRFASALRTGGNGVERQESPLGLASRLDSEVYMRSQLLRDADATSMAHSVELRMPLVDSELARFARGCRASYKLSEPGAEQSVSMKGIQKHLLVEALRGVLPEDILNRPKRGFGLPYNEWLRGPLREIAMDTTSASAVKKRGMFEPRAVAQTREAFLDGDAAAEYPRLWSLMILELWCRQVLDGEPCGTQ
jgi:asparagine synthase (glutamine-hydrolysing)